MKITAIYTDYTPEIEEKIIKLVGLHPVSRGDRHPLDKTGKQIHERIIAFDVGDDEAVGVVADLKGEGCSILSPAEFADAVPTLPPATSRFAPPPPLSFFDRLNPRVLQETVEEPSTLVPDADDKGN